VSRVALGLLAGGAARRLGGTDKPLLPLADGRPVLAHMFDRLMPWPGPAVLSANGDPARFAAFGLPVVADAVTEADGGRAGPLAGVLAVLEWAAAGYPDVTAVVTVPGDTPGVPADLLDRLCAARDAERADIACAASGGRVHFATALWPVALAPALRRAMTGEGMRAVGGWIRRYRVAIADWPVDGEADGLGADPFLNINGPEDLARARRSL
jgi:molybdopterin-guanine dinucleotide biosynthesis protein A